MQRSPGFRDILVAIGVAGPEAGLGGQLSIYEQAGRIERAQQDPAFSGGQDRASPGAKEKRVRAIVDESRGGVFFRQAAKREGGFFVLLDHLAGLFGFPGALVVDSLDQFDKHPAFHEGRGYRRIVSP